MTTVALADDLHVRLSPGAVVRDPAALPAYGQDYLANRGTPGVVVEAASHEDVVQTLRYASARGIAVTPRAAGTNVSAAFLTGPERIALDLRRMNAVTMLDPGGRRAVVQPGVINGDLQARLAPLGLCYSPDPASAAISSIGGNIATNAGGPRCCKYGVTVHHVQGVTCVLPGGDTLRLAADDPGPDWLGVVIGSEGTLAIVTEATLRLRPLPAVTRTLLAVFDSTEAAVEAVSATIAAGLLPAALEFFDQAFTRILEAHTPSGYPTDAEALLLIDLDGEPDTVAWELEAVDAVMRRFAREVRRADDDTMRARLWHGRLQGAHALNSGGRGVYFGDVTVPRGAIPAMQRGVERIAREYGVQIVNLGHIGDGNLHPTILYDRTDARATAAIYPADDAVVALALQLGGTLTGEHGVGSAKRRQMPARFSPAEIATMRAVKRAFDPDGLLNPGVLYPDPSPLEPPLPRFTDAVQRVLDARQAGTAWEATESRAAPSSTTGRPAQASLSRATSTDTAVIVVDPANMTATAPADTPAAELHRALAVHRLHSALPRTGTLRDALSDAAARTAVRDELLAVDVSLRDGPSARFGSNAVKDVAGLDLKRLWTGSGAAFGSLANVTLHVTPIPQR